VLAQLLHSVQPHCTTGSAVQLAHMLRHQHHLDVGALGGLLQILWSAGGAIQVYSQGNSCS
jgi:hypothetical protein